MSESAAHPLPVQRVGAPLPSVDRARAMRAEADGHHISQIHSGEEEVPEWKSKIAAYKAKVQRRASTTAFPCF
jgi:hypothetical protein